jgi:hypothetical protein
MQQYTFKLTPPIPQRVYFRSEKIISEPVDQSVNLKQLSDNQLISELEYQQMKKKLLNLL